MDYGGLRSIRSGLSLYVEGLRSIRSGLSLIWRDYATHGGITFQKTGVKGGPASYRGTFLRVNSNRFPQE